MLSLLLASAHAFVLPSAPHVARASPALTAEPVMFGLFGGGGAKTSEPTLQNARDADFARRQEKLEGLTFKEQLAYLEPYLGSDELYSLRALAAQTKDDAEGPAKRPKWKKIKREQNAKAKTTMKALRSTQLYRFMPTGQ